MRMCIIHYLNKKGPIAQYLETQSPKGERGLMLPHAIMLVGDISGARLDAPFCDAFIKEVRGVAKWTGSYWQTTPRNAQRFLSIAQKHFAVEVV